MARGGRVPGLVLSLPRLERADHGRVLRPERRLPDPGRGEADRRHREQLLPDQLQLRADPALLDGGPRAGGVPGDPRRRPPEPGALLRARLGAGAGLQPHDPPAGEPPRQGDPGALGDRRFRPPLRQGTGGDVAPGDGGGPGKPGDPGGARDAVRDPGAPPGASRPADRQPRLAGCGRGRDRPEGPLPDPALLGTGDGAVLLRRADLAGRRLRTAADQRGGLREPDSRGIRRRRERTSARPHRHRRGELRAPPPARGDGALLRPAPHRVEQAGEDHQLRGVSRAVPPGAGGGDPPLQLLELRPRDRAVAEPLRLQLGGTAGVDPGVAPPPAGGAGLAAGEAGGALYRRLDGAFPGSLGRPGRLRVGGARPLRGECPGLSRTARGPGAVRGGTGPGAQAARAPAPRDSDVHQLRLVLRRALRDRDHADPPVRGARHPAGGGDRRAGYRVPLPVPSRACEEQPPGARGRPAHLREVRQALRR